MAVAFAGVGITIPLLPTWVTVDAGLSDGWVGVVALVGGVAGAVGRVPSGLYLRYGDPWRLIRFTLLVGALGAAAVPLTHGVLPLLLCRAVLGFAVGTFYGAAVSCVVLRAAPERLGSRLSVLSAALFFGQAAGPVVSDQLIEAWGTRVTWLVVAATIVCGLLLATPAGPPGGAAPGAVRRPAAPVDVARSLAHPRAALPAAAVFLVLAGWSTIQAYAPLYGPTVGVHDTGSVFLVFALVLVAIRTLGARLFDRLPLIPTILAGCVTNLVGTLALVAVPSAATLYAAAVLMALTLTLTFNNLLRIALAGVPDEERGAVTGSYSLAYDLSLGAGAAAMGTILESTGSYPAMFAGAAAAGAGGLALTVLLSVRRSSVRPGPAPAAPATGAR